MLSLNELKKSGFIMESYESGSERLLLKNKHVIKFIKLPVNTLNIISKLSEIDEDYNFLLHIYYKLIPDYNSYNIALEIGLIKNLEYDEFKKYIRFGKNCNTFHMSTLFEIDKINKSYNNKFNSLVRNINKEIRENSAIFYLTIITSIFAITGILQTIAAFKWHN
jgi:hypothetical protein